MGVTYKLKDEVVQYIISQRQSNPLYSCRQLAESASQKFGLHLSKSSVHDVLKESGIVTPRGRKPKDKFEIPQEKKKQIQVSLSQVKLISPIVGPDHSHSEHKDSVTPPDPSVILSEAKDLKTHLDSSPSAQNDMATNDSSASPQNDIENRPRRIEDVGYNIPQEPASQELVLQEPAVQEPILLPQKEEFEITAEYEGAGKIFLKAVLWDLGIYSGENIKATDWDYYLTYCKGIKVVLENNKYFFIDLPLPLERCIREAVDGLVNNVKPLIIHKVTDETLFKACMEGQGGFGIEDISIVGHNDHILLELGNIMEFKRNFIEQSRVFVESNERDSMERTKITFFSQNVNNNDVIESIMNLKGFDTTSKDENIVTLLIEDSYNNKNVLQEAAEKLNGMCLRDEQDRLVKVKIQIVIPKEGLGPNKMDSFGPLAEQP